jgi:biopolymer transport protein ExbB
MFQDFDWLQAMTTSPVMVIIAACSIITTGFALERLVYFWRRRDRVSVVVRTALERVRDGDVNGAARECARSRHPLGPVAAEVLQNLHRTGTESEETLQIALAEQRLLLERNLGFLGTMGNTAPLIGLLGTVWGIMRAFHDMARTGSAGPSVVAAGVAEALFTTAAGLLVAVPAVLLFNHFTRRITVMLVEAENYARQLRLAAVGKPAERVRGRETSSERSQAAEQGVPGVRAPFEMAVRP